MRTLTALFLALGLSLITAPSSAIANPPAAGQPGGPMVPMHANGELTFTSFSTDPGTGFTVVTGDIVLHGTFGLTWGTDTYQINPASGAYTGTGTRQCSDGSTYDVQYIGQFINATDSVGGFTISGGTGRFQGMGGSGSFTSSRWASGLGSSSVISGSATF